MTNLGNYQDNILTGTEGDDFIFGSAGNDTFLCYRGNDVAFGGRGNDTFIVAPQFDATVYIDGGAGSDILHLAREANSVECVRGRYIIEYDYDMVIVADNVEQIVYG